jgi:serine/threonine-protein kinase HipA
MERIKTLNVFFDNKKVGTLAETGDHLIAFEYDSRWIQSGFSISPISLPLRKEVFVPKKIETFDGLFGVFSDSLPDGWGRLLVDRMLRRESIKLSEVNTLTRLAIVGESGMGALTYKPATKIETGSVFLTIDEIAARCKEILESNQSENLDEIFCLGGSSGGARPKVNYQIDGEEWIVKFPSSIDHIDIGIQEYKYSLCAKKCGINMTETRLLESKNSSGYFATKRFDRLDLLKVHMVSVGGLLETSHRIPNLDYQILMKLTMMLTSDFSQVEQLYRMMCFNVFAHNRDDHAKNFSFIFNQNKNKWEISPAYDLTYSNSIGGEHATTINGNGRNPQIKDLLEVARTVNFDGAKARRIVNEIKEIVQVELAEYI